MRPFQQIKSVYCSKHMLWKFIFRCGWPAPENGAHVTLKWALFPREIFRGRWGLDPPLKMSGSRKMSLQPYLLYSPVLLQSSLSSLYLIFILSATLWWGSVLQWHHLPCALPLPHPRPVEPLLHLCGTLWEHHIRLYRPDNREPTRA